HDAGLEVGPVESLEPGMRTCRVHVTVAQSLRRLLQAEAEDCIDRFFGHISRPSKTFDASQNRIVDDHTVVGGERRTEIEQLEGEDTECPDIDG
ncbi:hypothetical protein PFISCL1PPCAC_14219, partial [Pristionchus fissidentatus]